MIDNNYDYNYYLSKDAEKYLYDNIDIITKENDNLVMKLAFKNSKLDSPLLDSIYPTPTMDKLGSHPGFKGLLKKYNIKV